MSLNNFNTTHLTKEQENAINEALTNLENVLKNVIASLTPEDRNRLGRVNEQNKLLINKIYDYALSQPELRSPDVDWEEFFKDYAMRVFCERILNRLENLSTGVRNRKILGDYDNHQDSLTDYAYTGYKAGTNAPGYEEKHRECKQFFARTKKNNPPKEENNPS